jgi:hypothetical protein
MTRLSDAIALRAVDAMRLESRLISRSLWRHGMHNANGTQGCRLMLKADLSSAVTSSQLVESFFV